MLRVDYFYPRSPYGERLAPKQNPTEQRDFYPRSPYGERLLAVQLGCRSFLFLSTLSLRRATASNQTERQGQRISIHALLTESDLAGLIFFFSDVSLFLSTLSLRRATVNGGVLLSFFDISIHALLTESDACIMTITTCTVLFLSTLSLRRATKKEKINPTSQTFLSTLSLRRATTAMVGLLMCNLYFYPRSPYGERHTWQRGSRVTYVEISIHALLTESDDDEEYRVPTGSVFLSTLSLRRATLGTLKQLASI